MLMQAMYRAASAVDRLGGIDVLLHHGPEDGGFAVVEHDWHSTIPSARVQRAVVGKV